MAAYVARSAAPSVVVGWLVAASVPNALLWVSRPPTPLLARPFWGALVLMLPVVALLLTAPPLLSDDIYRFAWDARMWLHGHNAYARAPLDPGLSEYRDRIFSGINFPHVATIYPPLAQLLFVLGYSAGGGALLGIKGVAWLGHVAVVGLLASSGVARWLADTQGVAGEGLCRVQTQRVFAFAFNPLALAETALCGHIDTYVGLALLLAALAVTAGRMRASVVWLGVCSGLKLFGVLFVPWLWPRARRLAVLLAFLSLGLFIPSLGAGGERSTAGLAAYAQHWRGNDGAFSLVEFAVASPLCQLVTRPAGGGKVRFEAAIPVLRAVEKLGGTPRYQSEAELPPLPLGVYPRAYLRGLIARLLVVLGLVAVAWWLGRDLSQPRHIRTLVLCLLWVSPQVHPWYLLWLLPLDVALGCSLMVV